MLWDYMTLFVFTLSAIILNKMHPNPHDIEGLYILQANMAFYVTKNISSIGRLPFSNVIKTGLFLKG